jgi:2-keto-4-pentenoate hydratase/2-oxohepta-3-ene-1,7-dioic acid hydratase in catechol pathway
LPLARASAIVTGRLCFTWVREDSNVKLVTYQSASGPRAAGLRGDDLIDLNQSDGSLPACLKSLLAEGEAGLQRAAIAVARGEPLAARNVRLLAPIPQPQKVICVGLNYIDHARESGVEPPHEPVLFNKFPTSVAAHDDAIRLPAASDQVDYEAELVVVIGSGGKHIAAEDAFSRIAGYCCGHDVSARDWQLRKPGGQWLLGKTFDGFAPFGPALVTKDEAGDPGDLRIALRLNGQTMQDSSTRQLIFSVQELVAYISRVATLMPGDVIFTGTPPGVGMARKPPVFLKPGDTVEVEIEKLGLLRNTFIAETK